MILRILPLLILLFLPLGVSAILPPVAEHRTKEVLEYRTRKKQEYEHRQKVHEEKMVASRIRVKALMQLPPAGDSVGGGGKETRTSRLENETAFKDAKKNRRWSLSAMALVFIAAAAWAIRHFLKDSKVSQA